MTPGSKLWWHSGSLWINFSELCTKCNTFYTRKLTVEKWCYVILYVCSISTNYKYVTSEMMGSAGDINYLDQYWQKQWHIYEICLYSHMSTWISYPSIFKTLRIWYHQRFLFLCWTWFQLCIVGNIADTVTFICICCYCQITRLHWCLKSFLMEDMSYYSPLCINHFSDICHFFHATNICTLLNRIINTHPSFITRLVTRPRQWIRVSIRSCLVCWNIIWS